MAPAKEPDMAQNPSKPVKTFRLRGISVSVFANQAKSEGRDIVFHKVSVQRTYSVSLCSQQILARPRMTRVQG